ncbi:MAG: phosphoribosylglycinamide formyltransferase [Verrucomicrobiota bacterium]|jgi:phosphoribosylglycinamide formyltransferase-1|nr:phosphoribosylglycinamide formyltransferase [Verrucomicrobiota bacterium]
MSNGETFRIGVLGSGNGSNLIAITEAIERGELSAEIALVLSDVKEAEILQHAKRRGLMACYIAPGKYRTKLDEETEKSYSCALQQADVDLVVLAGFMRILKDELLKSFPGKVINIHPSLLPSFPGVGAWKQALDHGVKFTGATVHFVDQGIDSGAIIAQEPVPLLDGDTPESLLDRIQQTEHRIYPKAIADIAEGRIISKGHRTFRSTK